MSLSSGSLQARIGDATLTVERDGDTLLVNGEPTDARVTRLDEYTVLLMENGVATAVGIEPQEDGTTIVTVNGKRVTVEVKTATDLLLESFGMEAGASTADREIRAPMPGMVLRVLVAPGDTIEAGQGVAVLEAMKMENELKSPSAGIISAVHAEPGVAVGKNDLLIELGE